MTYLTLILACAAGAALVALLLSLVALLIHRLVQPLLASASASVRADVALLAGLVAPIASVSVIVGALAPSAASFFGLGTDHCPTHTHHLHLCLRHASTLPLALVATGVAVIGAFSLRAMMLGVGLVRTARHISALERCGTATAGARPVVSVPGAPRLCHATGWRRPRIVISKELFDALAPAERAAALAHETAHLRRCDPLASVVLAVAGLFSPRAIATVFQSAYRQASEEACDADAAHAVGAGHIVAEALLKVAALQTSAAPGSHACPAFAEIALERRVRLLIAPDVVRASGTHWIATGTTLVTSLVVLAFAKAPAIHHGLETILDHLF